MKTQALKKKNNRKIKNILKLSWNSFHYILFLFLEVSI